MDIFPEGKPDPETLMLAEAALFMAGINERTCSFVAALTGGLETEAERIAGEVADEGVIPLWFFIQSLAAMAASFMTLIEQDRGMEPGSALVKIATSNSALAEACQDVVRRAAEDS